MSRPLPELVTFQWKNSEKSLIITFTTLGIEFFQKEIKKQFSTKTFLARFSFIQDDPQISIGIDDAFTYYKGNNGRHSYKCSFDVCPVIASNRQFLSIIMIGELLRSILDSWNKGFQNLETYSGTQLYMFQFFSAWETTRSASVWTTSNTLALIAESFDEQDKKEVATAILQSYCYFGATATNTSPEELYKGKSVSFEIPGCDSELVFSPPAEHAKDQVFIDPCVACCVSGIPSQLAMLVGFFTAVERSKNYIPY